MRAVCTFARALGGSLEATAWISVNLFKLKSRFACAACFGESLQRFGRALHSQEDRLLKLLLSAVTSRPNVEVTLWAAPRAFFIGSPADIKKGGFPRPPSKNVWNASPAITPGM